MSAVLADVAATDASTWELRPLAEVADILDGKRIPVNAKERDKRPGRVPYYGATGQVGWIDDSLFDEELVLLGEDGAPFLDPSKPKAYVIRGKSWVNNHAHVLRARAVPTAWLAHYLNVVRYDRLVTGTTRLKLTQAAMRQIRVPVAPWHVMEERVAELEKQFSRLDEAVANLKRAKANLKRYKAAVLKSAVEGRLVPTEADVAGREGRSYEAGDALVERILEARRRNWAGKGKYKEPAAIDLPKLPTLPEGWTWTSLDSLSWDSGYGTSAKCSRENRGVPVLRIPNVQNGAIDLSDLKFAPLDFPLSPEDRVSRGDMLIIRTNGSKALIGRAAIVPDMPAVPLAFASYLIRFRLCGEGQIAPWVSTVWAESRLRAWLEANAATSAGQHNISQSVLATAAIPVPPVAEQRRIVAEVERTLSLANALEREADRALLQSAAIARSVLTRTFC